MYQYVCCGYCIGCWLLAPLGLHGLLGGWYRWRLRQKDKVDGTALRDLLSHWCCCCCALVQDRRQYRAENFLKQSKKAARTEKEDAAATDLTKELPPAPIPVISFGMYTGEIVDHRRREGDLEYRVHWQRKSPDEDEWFPRQDLIEEYPDVVVHYERFNAV